MVQKHGDARANLSRSDSVMVAVGFNPRFSERKTSSSRSDG